MIYTIGYQRLDLNGLNQVISRYSIMRVLDIRSKPFSKRKGFNRNELENNPGIFYEWHGDVLGGFGGITDNSIRKLAIEKENILLMCMETHPCDCHRFNNIAIRLLDMGQEATHLIGNRQALTSEIINECQRRDEERKAQTKLFL